MPFKVFQQTVAVYCPYLYLNKQSNIIFISSDLSNPGEGSATPLALGKAIDTAGNLAMASS